jgi:hypothetical protein
VKNYKLQLHALRLKHQSATLGQRVAQTRLRVVKANLEMARLKLTALERELKRELQLRHLDLSAIAEIKKIQALMGDSRALGRSHEPRAVDALQDGENPPDEE